MARSSRAYPRRGAAAFLAVDAEGKSLEDIARPLSVIAKPPEAIFRSGDLYQGGVSPSAGD